MPQIINLKGQTFGRLTVLDRTEPRSKIRGAWWECRCICGKRHPIPARSLRSGATKSCGCLLYEHLKRLRPFESMFNILKSKARGHEVRLTYEEFLEFTKQKQCHYCLAWLDWAKDQRYNLDRMNNDLGYTKENCVVCCPRCNYGKSNLFTYQEWYGMTDWFRMFRRIKCQNP